MPSSAQLLAVVVTIILARVVAQYNDGYETVNSATDPVQIRLAYQGPTAMMGKLAHDTCVWHDKPGK